MAVSLAFYAALGFVQYTLDRSTLKYYYKGRVSVALINSDKGMSFLNGVIHEFYAEKRKIVEAISGNSQLIKPLEMHKDRKKFIDNYEIIGFYEAIKNTGIKKDVRIRKIRNIILYPYHLIKNNAWKKG